MEENKNRVTHRLVYNKIVMNAKLTLAIALIFFMISACDRDNDSDGNVSGDALYGEWISLSDVFDDYGGNIDSFDRQYDDNNYWIYRFEKDKLEGQLYSNNVLDVKSSFSDEISIVKDKIYWDDEVWTYSVKGNYLTMTCTEDDEYTETMTFKRK